jgi:hypothetical protein
MFRCAGCSAASGIYGPGQNGAVDRPPPTHGAREANAIQSGVVQSEHRHQIDRRQVAAFLRETGWSGVAAIAPAATGGRGPPNAFAVPVPYLNLDLVVNSESLGPYERNLSS